MVVYFKKLSAVSPSRLNKQIIPHQQLLRKKNQNSRLRIQCVWFTPLPSRLLCPLQILLIPLKTFYSSSSGRAGPFGKDRKQNPADGRTWDNHHEKRRKKHRSPVTKAIRLLIFSRNDPTAGWSWSSAGRDPGIPRSHGKRQKNRPFVQPFVSPSLCLRLHSTVFFRNSLQTSIPTNWNLYLCRGYSGINSINLSERPSLSNRISMFSTSPPKCSTPNFKAL